MTLFHAVLTLVATLATLAAAEQRYQGHVVSSPTSWFNMWFTTPERQRESRRPRQKQLFGYADHNGPDTWALDFPACAGYRQSPIDLEPESMLRLLVPEHLSWRDYWRKPLNMTVTNTGHTIQVSGGWEDGEAPSLSGGPLDGEYVFAQLHFHWGSDDDSGSEHTVQNDSFPMEMHVLHYRREYGNAEVAMRYENGLAVVSQLFRLSENSNPILERILEAAGVVRTAQLQVPLSEPFRLSDMGLGFQKDYVTYSGSLTTPPCSEVVTWVVSARPLSVSFDQLEELRSLNSFDGEMEDNFRPVQPRNGRPVFYVS